MIWALERLCSPYVSLLAIPGNYKRQQGYQVGILCDDMGLGKTLQSICIIAGDNYRRQQRYQVGILCDDMGLGKTLQSI